MKTFPAFADFQADTPAPKQVDLPTPIASLKDLSTDAATVENYNTARQLLALTLHDESIPLNQKVQVLNTLNTIIASVLKQQEAIHNIETLKVQEDTLIHVLKGFPEVNEAFLTAYATALGETDTTSLGKTSTPTP